MFSISVIVTVFYLFKLIVKLRWNSSDFCSCTDLGHVNYTGSIEPNGNILMEPNWHLPVENQK